MIATTQSLINMARLYIPDPKTRTKTVRREEIGRTALATGTRETFYVKHSPIGSVLVYVEPYDYHATSSLGSAATNSKVFLWASSTLSCTFPNGTTDPSHRPNQYTPVLADYEYTERLPYSYTDNELVEFFKNAVGYLNNSYDFSYVFTGTISSFSVTPVTDNDTEILSKGLAIVVRRSYVDEQKKQGLGIVVRGPLQMIDSKSALNDYQLVTKRMENELLNKAQENKRGQLPTGQVIDIYDENVVED